MLGSSQPPRRPGWTNLLRNYIERTGYSSPRRARRIVRSDCPACGASRGLCRFPRIVDFDDTAATLRCRGDEDRSTQGIRRPALARAIRAQSDVVVDLSQLVFADSSVMLDLAVLARRLRVRGRGVRLRGPQPQILTLIELVGLHRQPGVELEGPAPALA